LSKRTKAEALLVLSSFIWGVTFVVVKSALLDAAPFPFLVVRFISAGLLMWLVLARGRIDPKVIGPALLLGVFLFAGYAFQTWGLLTTTPSKSAFITGFSVILVPVVSLGFGYRMRAANVAGAALGLMGLYFLVMPSRLESVNRGDILTLLCAISFAIHIVLVGVYTRRLSFLHFAPAQILVVGLFSIVALPFSPPWVVHWTPRLVWAIAITAIFATGVAFAGQIWAQKYTPPAHTALIFALEPVFAALTSCLFAGEHLGSRMLLGSAFVLAGMVISETWGAAAPSPVKG